MSLKSIITIITIGFSSIAAVLTTWHTAVAQLRVGESYGVQPGLESNYLQYQLQGQDLTKLRSIPACDIGFGLSCNKPGAVLERLLEINNGPSYQELLMRAAGGANNFQQFASFYENSSQLSRTPYASFWQQDSPEIVDGYRYVLGRTVSRTPVEGLGTVTRNFYWSPLSANDDALSLRNGLLDLKYSYGRLLLEEAAKLPQLQQQIQSLGLPPAMTQYYQNKLNVGLRALNQGDEGRLRSSILEVLSMPFSPDGGPFGRPSLNLRVPPDALIAEGLTGDVLLTETPISLTGDEFLTEIISPEVSQVLPPAEDFGRGLPPWLIPGALGGGGLLLLLLLLPGGDGSSDGSPVPPAPIPGNGNPIPPTNVCDPTPGGGNPVTTIPPCPPDGGTPPGVDVERVPEPSIISAVVLLTLVVCLINQKQRTLQTKG